VVSGLFVGVPRCYRFATVSSFAARSSVRTPMLDGASAATRTLLASSAIEPEDVAAAVIHGLLRWLVAWDVSSATASRRQP
jgi:hypothetical protein